MARNGTQTVMGCVAFTELGNSEEEHLVVKIMSSRLWPGSSVGSECHPDKPKLRV